MRPELENPWMLVLLVLLIPIWWRWLARKPHAAVRFSSVDWLRRQGTSFRVKARVLLPFLRTVAMVLLIFCLARPRQPNQETRIFSEGIAIQMLVDCSGSMEALDFTIEGERVNRLEAVKKVIRDFIQGDGDDLEGRPDDLLGMITFAQYTDGICPLTLDRSFVLASLAEAEIPSDEERNGTAIGDAISLGVGRMRDLEKRRDRVSAQRIKSKIMILLTDGENNAGVVSPKTAAELAAKFDVKIYTIGAGTTGYAPVPYVNAFGQVTQKPMRVSIDEDTLREIADVTGGKYWRATDTASLREIYAEIDKLERTETEEKRYFQYAELATESVRVGWLTLPPLLCIAGLSLVLEIFLANTRLRKVP